jgi:hypothetical protein
MMFGIVSEHFANPQHVKRCKTCVSGLNALFRATEGEKHPFDHIRPKMMRGSVSKHLANLRHIKWCYTCVSGLNALFWGIEVEMHPLYSGWPEMMFGSVLHHFANLQTKKMKNSSFGPDYFRVAKLRNIHSTPLDPKWCLGGFQNISLTRSMSKDAKLVFRNWMHLFGVPKLRSIHSTTFHLKWCLGLFQSI